MNILLHICCAPCALYPIKRLKDQGQEIRGIWYNPNIHPYQEYRRRMESLKDYAARTDLPMSYEDEYGLVEFLRGVVHDEENRCSFCYHLRLQRVAKVAREGKFDSFSTTLLASPHQRHDLIKKMGEQAAREMGIEFHYEDLREGGKESRELSKEMGLYHQQYCGCIYSEYERFKRK